ncbi:bifunctional adenosylcobinamide kinase/adenosylcobinamide-phosphate guanylyltransferase [Phenylobacterium sp.]|uniref:bifunctional adenosylcobinamide kinase/adenosylcobinamide-phosphate guanylyltransferase n=1 Tax=Phenylobacterium sp. TaxID=1871053 RepID=UPI00272F0683|nr:bifunctional adenosylcobinamide kinase/adenosylcobinamide-phosphate guanylyltransferase [Phenylobacterium sp.]MDP1619244.1 bifunctional adenosylcobinamide kinase/adenosylcobinamide-phosphate guanylyltransferase [Phenylobacterium sp.]MDP1986768.1 bifunctional adenosylcobinamide kinase/adenosylcobinamide-phosphate guanylyltransferase [Phenylobacterium sp.]
MTATIVLGGARSGKSAYAQARAEAAAGAARQARLVMIVTAQAFDEEMDRRIAQHQADRDSRWVTVEAPIDLAGAISALKPEDVAVVDCLTLWLSNLMMAEADIEAATATLIEAVVACPATLLLVSNEVGWGIVPDNALARQFRDHAGRLHQRLAAAADEALLIVAGLPMTLKPAPAAPASGRS